MKPKIIAVTAAALVLMPLSIARAQSARVEAYDTDLSVRSDRVLFQVKGKLRNRIGHFEIQCTVEDFSVYGTITDGLGLNKTEKQRISFHSLSDAVQGDAAIEGDKIKIIFSTVATEDIKKVTSGIKKSLDFGGWISFGVSRFTAFIHVDKLPRGRLRTAEQIDIVEAACLRLMR